MAAQKGLILLETKKRAPFLVEWYPGQAGYHEVYTVARDDKGNRKVSDVLGFSIGYVEAPKVEINSPLGDLHQHRIYYPGSFPTFTANAFPGDARIHQVFFQSFYISLLILWIYIQHS